MQISSRFINTPKPILIDKDDKEWMREFLDLARKYASEICTTHDVSCDTFIAHCHTLANKLEIKASQTHIKRCEEAQKVLEAMKKNR